MLASTHTESTVALHGALSPAGQPVHVLHAADPDVFEYFPALHAVQLTAQLASEL